MAEAVEWHATCARVFYHGNLDKKLDEFGAARSVESIGLDGAIVWELVEPESENKRFGTVQAYVIGTNEKKVEEALDKLIEMLGGYYEKSKDQEMLMKKDELVEIAKVHYTTKDN